MEEAAEIVGVWLWSRMASVGQKHAPMGCAPDGADRVLAHGARLPQEVRFVLLGGKEIGPKTLLRGYVVHVLFLPFVIVIFMAIHFWRVRKDGGISGPI